MPGKQKLYWDANIFIAWLHAETAHGPGVLDGIDEMACDINRGISVLFTSVITKTQVLEHRLTPRAQEMFSNLFKRHNVSMVNVDERIADRSHAIRNHYSKQGKTLSSEDCVHLATAILYKADVFYTLERIRPAAAQH